MKNTVLLIALAGLTTVATAEDFILSIAGAPTTVDATNGATITIDIIGDSTHGEYFMAGSFSMSSMSELITRMSWAAGPWSSFNTDNGYAGNGNYNHVIFAQFALQGEPHPESTLGSAIGSFQVEIAAGSFGIIHMEITNGSPFTLETAFGFGVQPPGGGSYDHRNDTESGNNLILNGVSINVVPAPSALALLGLGGLAMSRRRR